MRLLVRLALLRKASQLGLLGGETPDRKGRKPRDAQRPPGEGWLPIPGSRHGGMHRPKPGGGFDYWYPGSGVGQVHPEDMPTAPAEPERHPLDTSDAVAGPLRLGMTLHEAEDAIAGEEHEHAIAFAGDDRHLARLDPKSTLALVPGVDTRKACAVPESVREALRADGFGTFTHNHPSGSCLSVEDAVMAVDCNVWEMRATTRDGTWVLTRPEAGWPSASQIERWYKMDFSGAMSTAFQTMDARVRAAGGNPHEGPNAKGFDPELWKRLTRDASIEAWTRGPNLSRQFSVRWSARDPRPELAPSVPAAGGAPGEPMTKAIRLVVSLTALRKAQQFGAPLAKAHVRAHRARNPGGYGSHEVRPHSRYAPMPAQHRESRWGPIEDGAAPFGAHANWLAAHQKLLAASAQRLGEGRYPQARALYDLAHQVRGVHDATFQMSNRIAEDPGAPMHAEASRAYYAMQYPKERHPLELFHDVLAGRNRLGRADKVHAHFRRDRDYEAASAAYDQGDRSALDSWWRSKIASFEGNEELTKYIGDSLAKWREGFKVAPTDPNRCDRCGGQGYLKAFKHVSGGECFECGGSGTKDTHMGEVLRKAIALPSLVLVLEPMAKGVSSLTVQALPGAGASDNAWTVGPYSFKLSKGQSGVSILTVTGGNLPQPYHLVVRGRADALRQSPAVAKAFAEGRVPDEGVFRREGIAPVRYGAA